MIQLLTVKLADELLERVRRNIVDAVAELQKQPAVSARTISGVTLQSGISTPIPHGLSRAPSFVSVSAVRGAVAAGYVNDVSSSSTYDRAKYITLQANSYGATITVDLWVVP